MPTLTQNVSAEEQILLAQLDRARMPTHIAIIMDGNGRWAKERGLSVHHGHQAGRQAVKRTIQACLQLGIPYLTVYAFSTENWQRPASEVNFLMKLLEQAIDDELGELKRTGVRVRVIGRLNEKLPETLVRKVCQVIEETKHNRKLTLTIALNYGGRAEIIDAARKLATEAAAGRLDPRSITEENFHEFLYTNGTPDPDLVIRTGGEMRLSNFLLWQLAYAEFVSTPVYWPDFDKAELIRAILEYQRRERRFGGRHGDHQSDAR
ncbi:MAG: isoprenyl transferase [Candidatus Bipolaricaulia bacterium]